MTEIINILITFLTLIVLTITLYWIIKYTKETQKMKEEMVYQRILKDAYDISLNMEIGAYDLKIAKELSVFKLKAFYGNNSNITDLYFLDYKEKRIERPNKFYKVAEEDNFCQTSYYMNLSARKIFLETLNKQKGKIKAFVKTTNGNSFIYTYQAYSQNYKIAHEKQNHHPIGGGSDHFSLIKKIIC